MSRRTCCHCGQTDNAPLWVHDDEGNVWHMTCRVEFLQRVEDQLERMKKARQFNEMLDKQKKR